MKNMGGVVVTACGVKSLDITSGERVYRNLNVSRLVEIALARREGMLTNNGALCVQTGKYTGRSPDDKFIVDGPVVHDKIDWGPINRPFPSEKFNQLYNRLMDYLKGKELFVFDGFVGAHSGYRMALRVINELAWQNIFVHQLFIRPTKEELSAHKPEFTVIAAPGFQAVPETDGTRSEAFVIVNFEQRLIIIGGTHYAGEIKKSVFSVFNYLLPGMDILPMHCSANTDQYGNNALFFGLSGTGKTTLSSDTTRLLIGDDEHGWCADGVFNFEAGCYAKCIHLTEKNEPQIWNAIRFGAVLENVVVDPETRVVDFDSDTLTENTRAAYPVNFIPASVFPGIGGHPRAIIFLTADAFGVLPPLAKLTPGQAMYYFLSGYTSKLAGTERGVNEPWPTFSACFGAPFLPRHPLVYAEMLGERIARHKSQVYLVNTGWSGGPYGVGQRMNLALTRAIVNAVLNGDLNDVEFKPHAIFKILMPEYCPGIPEKVLNPQKTWQDPAAYVQAAEDLAGRFKENFAKFNGISREIACTGPGTT